MRLQKMMHMVRFTPSIDDVNAVALSVLRHRLVTNFSAEAEGVSVDTIIRELTARK